VQKGIDKISRKVVFKFHENPEVQKYTIDNTNLKEYLGLPKYTQSYSNNKSVPGVVMGLGANERGGSALFIETIAEKSPKPEVTLTVTGQLGAVMKESGDIAYTFAKLFLRQIDPKNTFFEKNSLHLNWLYGSIPKEGPSGGCAIVTSFLSLALNLPVPPAIAMTGEISLSGKVLPVGGIQTKTVAAIRDGAKTVIYPKHNKSDFDLLLPNIKNQIQSHFVEDYKQLFNIIFSPSSRSVDKKS